MNKALFEVFALISSLIIAVDSANILLIIPFTSSSHYIQNRVIGLELAKRGHNVTVITSFAEENPPPNYEEILTEKKIMWHYDENAPSSPFAYADMTFFSFFNFLWKGGIWMTKNYFESPNMKKFLADDTRKYDLVISEVFFQEATYMFAHKYGAPLILTTTFGNSFNSNFLTGNPLQLSYAHNQYSALHPPFGLWGKMKNVFFCAYEWVGFKLWYIKQQEKIVEEYFKDLPQPVPRLEDLHKEAAVVFLNSHFSVDLPRPYMPNVIEVGGIQLQYRSSGLPQDLKDILDNAKDGVIYLSYGSNVQNKDMAPEKFKAYMNAFGKLKQTVLFKWEDTEIEHKPANVVIRNWFPQFDVLGHPNVKLFMSHGGLLGLQEAQYHGVPLLITSIFGDQHHNAMKAESGGYGRRLGFHDINEESLTQALEEILNNDIYTLKAKETSRRFNDRIVSPVDTMAFWVEYVIRHKSANFYKSPSREMSFIEYTLLDVALAYVFITFGIYKLVSKFVSFFSLLFAVRSTNVGKKLKTK